jgi:hypothetical protein
LEKGRHPGGGLFETALCREGAGGSTMPHQFKNFSQLFIYSLFGEVRPDVDYHYLKIGS